jgi:putative flippase GtrA
MQTARPVPQNPSMRIRIASWLAGHFPPGMVLRYTLVGAWNTAFGYSVFVAFNYSFTRLKLPVPYMLAVPPSNIINISVAFLGYKLFVFRTKGNWWREYWRTLAVYWSGFIPGMIAIPILVSLLRWAFHMGGAAPYVASAIITIAAVIYNFLGYSKYSFNQLGPPQTPAKVE